MRMIGRRNVGLSHSRQGRRGRLQFEPLESRTLLSATPTDDSFRLAIFADSGEVEIPADVGVQADDSTESLFTIEGNGEIYLDTANGQKLGDFFNVWQNNAGLAGNNPNAVLSEDQLLGNVEVGEKTVQMFVNGQVSTEFEDYAIQDGDQIVLVYGDNPVLSLNTNYGPIVVELFADATPVTVNNFLNYVNDGDYANSFLHRSVKDFVIQGGGYTTNSTTFTDTDQFSDIPADAPIVNESGISNLRGTFAMAKLGGNANSATSQFFVNLTNDHATTGAQLDTQNGGFTVFGHILDMTTVDSIAGLSITPASSIDNTISSNDASLYSELPLGTGNELVVVQSVAGQGKLSGVKYLDANHNGMHDNGEQLLAGVTVFLDANDSGALDSGETWTLTETDGSYRFQIEAGTYVVRSEVASGHGTTEPLAPHSYTVTVEIGRETTGLDFGAAELPAPSGVDLLASSDTGDADDDNLTRRNNADLVSSLQFLVSGVNNGAEVQIFADGTLIGSQVATGDTLTVTTTGAHTLADGIHSVTAVQLVGGASVPSDPLQITIDTTSPGGLTNQAPDIAQAGELYSFDAQSPEEGDVSYSLENAPAGMIIDPSTGEIAWTPTSDQAQPYSFDIVLADKAGNLTVQPVDLTVLGAIPAYPDAYSVEEDTVLTIATAEGVLANDGDTNSGTLTAAIVDPPANGTLVLNSDGAFEYTPNANFHGTDSLTYQATNTTGDESNVAKVTITVNSVNDAPVGEADPYTVLQNTTLITTATEGVLANDTDADGDALTATLVVQPVHGTVALHSNGSFTYVPDEDFHGTDVFTYRASDDIASSATTTVTMTVNPGVENPTDLGLIDFLALPQNDLTVGTQAFALQATHDGFLTFEALNTLASGSVAMTLYDTAGNTLASSSSTDRGQRIDWVTAANVSYFLEMSGTATDVDLLIANLLQHDGTTVTVHGTAAADDFLFSAEASRIITINGVPYAFEDAEVSVVIFDADKTLSDSGSDLVRIEGSALSETLTTTFEGDDLVPTMVFQTDPGAAQPFSVTATNFEQLLAWSRSGAADTAVFEDSPGRDKAKALPGDNASLMRGLGGYQNFYRRAKLFEEVTFVGANSPADDTVILFDTPGSDHFEFHAETGESRLVTESGLVCKADGYSEMLVRSRYEGGTDTATFIDSTETDKFVARPGKARLYSQIEGNEFDVVVRDFDEALVDFQNGGYDKARFTDSAGNDHFFGSPTESRLEGPGFRFTALQADEVSVTSLHNTDSDTAELHDTAMDDLLQCTKDQDNRPFARVWTPDAFGQMLYQLVDVETIDAYGTTGINTAAVDGVDFVELHGSWGRNARPVAVDDGYLVDEDASLTVNAPDGVLANDSDAESDSLTAMLVLEPSHGVVTLYSNGSFVYSPIADFYGTDMFTYRVNDGFGDSTEATVVITVNPIEDAPIAVDDSYAAAPNEPMSISATFGVLANDRDADGDSLIASLVTEPTHGTLLLSEDGSFIYTPEADFKGTDTFTYKVNDGTMDSAPATVTLMVDEILLSTG